jgi:hypothetical protein
MDCHAGASEKRGMVSELLRIAVPNVGIAIGRNLVKFLCPNITIFAQTDPKARVIPIIDDI